MLWTLEERADDLLVAVDPYFETPEPYVDEYDGTYVETDLTFSQTTTHTWNHGLGEIIGGLLETAWSSLRLKSIAACRRSRCPESWCATSMRSGICGSDRSGCR